MSHAHTTHRLNAHGICAICGCPQYAAVNLGLACPLNDKQYKAMWTDIENRIHPDWLNSTKKQCDEARAAAKEEAKKSKR